jgi:hypothetical protein
MMSRELLRWIAMPNVRNRAERQVVRRVTTIYHSFADRRGACLVGHRTTKCRKLAAVLSANGDCLLAPMLRCSYPLCRVQN